MTRRKFSPTALMTRLLECDGRCTECSTKVGGAYGLEWDHRIPLAMGGEDALDNLQPLCRPCHRIKTADDVKNIAKTKRQRQRSMGIHKRRTITEWRKFDGTIVRADK